MTLVESPKQISCPIPSDDWYEGIDARTSNNFYIIYTPALLEIDGGRVSQELDNFFHLRQGFPFQKPEDRDPNKVRLVEAAQDYIKSVTGFYPQEIQYRERELRESYLNGKRVGFKVTVYP